MFNMIITIIAIVLIVVLTAVGVYYGGSTTAEQKTKASAAQYRNEAQQISSAVTLFKAKGGAITNEFTLQTLVDQELLKSLPPGWEPSQNAIIKKLDPLDPKTESICYEANTQSGFKFDPVNDTDVSPYSKDVTKGIPNCDKANLDDQVPCCVK